MRKKEMLKSILLKQERLTTQLMELDAMIKSFNSTKEVDILDGYTKITNYDTTITALQEEKKELDVGKWYHADGILIYINKLYKDAVFGYGLNSEKGFWIEEDDNPWYAMQITHEATPQEVEQALIEEAKRRYKVGDVVSYLDDKNNNYPLYGHSLKFDVNENILYATDGKNHIVFANGQWATIIEQDKFAELKEAHKNGEVIEYKHASLKNDTWLMIENPSWNPTFEYRIKPEENPKVGDVCKFWIGNEEDYFVGVLDSISGVHNDYIVRFSKTESKFCSYLKARHAKKLTKEEAIHLLFNK